MTGTTILPIDMKDRRFRVRQESGGSFYGGDNFDGITLTIEIKSPDEARDVLNAILASDPS